MFVISPSFLVLKRRLIGEIEDKSDFFIEFFFEIFFPNTDHKMIIFPGGYSI